MEKIDKQTKFNQISAMIRETPDNRPLSYLEQLATKAIIEKRGSCAAIRYIRMFGLDPQKITEILDNNKNDQVE